MAKTDEVVNVDDDAGWTDVEVEDAGTDEGSEFVTKEQLEEMLAPLRALLEGVPGGDDEVTETDRPIRAKDVEAMIEQRMQKATQWLKGEMDKKSKAPKAKATKVEPEPTPTEPTKKDWRKMMWGEK
jgi:hypothetical protein